jgi:hypothetical protein
MSVVAAPSRAPSGDGIDVVYVLSLLQVSFLLLAGVGEVLLMGGNPLYLFLPVVKSALLLLFAAAALRRRRWALRGLVVLAWITLVGFGLQLVAHLLPWVDFSVNLVGLLTNLALPIAVIWLCRPELVAIKRARRAAKVLTVPQDPYAAPTVYQGQTWGHAPVAPSSIPSPGVAPSTVGPAVGSSPVAAASGSAPVPGPAVTTWEVPR